ncbi:DUF3021 family protein [Intestinimonas butyriciproducens]|uniref:Uncharacterized protein n=3 Tax=Intestinimonas butyriciproducens TaxID=1297617 RepID=A0A2U1C1G5_9FIRM|nr:DUF3021 family protein [Intestinimonas butyriciproducens]SCJ04587.1 Protein of uncharacterised function (DUF3021) [uncultured Clostridium sp.]MBU5230546.1 DUF3021 domain-containing protein [Intestinimonas butyriciproducens]MCI6362417.1 DUF3021 domain-containing protein [Intestinimonas butyriciproducens]MCR1906656.1 DUF3021 domain-containing protein [Intestinimonas butyriciproducens]MDB7860273.1 DUF3021 family protein [Intestinimonas butyriciproducens]
MSAGQKSWIVRILAGGLAGAGLAGAGYRPLFIGGFSAPPLCGALIQSCGILGAVAVTLALFFAFGAAVGVATLPFEGEGRSVLLRSGLHFLVTAGLLGAILRVCLGVAWRYLPGWLALLGAIYLVVWLGRWVGWYAEVRQLRSALGLEAGPSPLRWRESLPYLPVLLLVNAVLPAVLALLDAPDVPVLRALLIPCLLLPLGGFFPALSLGKRQGVCLLYPAASLLIFLPASLWVYGGQRIPLFWGIALACPLAGNLVGAAWRRRKERRRPQWNGCC